MQLFSLLLLWTAGAVHLGITFFLSIFFAVSVHPFFFTLVFCFLLLLVREREENVLWFHLWEEEEGRRRSFEEDLFQGEEEAQWLIKGRTTGRTKRRTTGRTTGRTPI